MKKNLQQLNLNPLSIAKFFYEKGVEDVAISQHLIYFTYLETMKEGYLIFKEEWKAWPNGPAIESVIDKMYDNYDNLRELFKKVKVLDNELVLSYAEKIWKKYKNTEQYLLFEKAQNKPWKDARKPLKSEREIGKIPLINLRKFVNGHSRLTT